MKTTASIPTTFCTVLMTTKCPSWVVPAHALQIQDGGGRHLEKLKNRHISAAVQPIFTKFGQNRLNCGRDMAIFRFFKMAAAAILDL